jgi:hypothetical protein
MARFDVTRDHRFFEGAKAVQELDRRKPDWRRAIVAANMSTCVRRIHHLLRRNAELRAAEAKAEAGPKAKVAKTPKMTVREAAAQVAVEYCIFAANFDAAVKKLQRAYGEAMREMLEKGLRTIDELLPRIEVGRHKSFPLARRPEDVEEDLTAIAADDPSGSVATIAQMIIHAGKKRRGEA